MSQGQPHPPGLLDLLVQEGLTTTAIAQKIRNKIRATWVPIGTLLRQRGHLSMSELASLLEIQTAEPHLRLGELAVREGFCTEEDVDEALRLQCAAIPHPVEVLLAEVTCDREELCKVLLRYIRALEARVAELPVSV